MSYKSNTHNALKQHYFTDKEISEFCTAFGCRGAKADGSNYLVAARLDKDSAESFCRSFSGCEDKYPGIGDINIGVYVMPDNSGACDGGKISQILRKADLAMYEAKIKRNGICMYEDR